MSSDRGKIELFLENEGTTKQAKKLLQDNSSFSKRVIDAQLDYLVPRVTEFQKRYVFFFILASKV